ncbi:MAG: hypothetical protein AAGE01_03030 [Pseudomonadota bacterium]
MVQIRNVPDDLHRLLKARAALAGRSLSDMILEELERLVVLPTPAELCERLSRVEPFTMSASSAEMIRRERDER